MENRMHFSHQGTPLNRRNFIRLSGLLGLGVASAALLPATAEAVRFNRRLHKVSKTRLAMGTVVSMTLIHSSRDLAEEAMGKAFEEIDRLTGLMNRFDRATAIAQLNKEGVLKGIPPEVNEVLRSALLYHRMSGGAFDISVKPVVDLFKASFQDRSHLPPSEKEIERAVRLVDSRNIILSNGNVSFARPGMSITLDGIAKGYIVDRASGLLAEHGVRDHLINAGGDIRTMGTKTDKKPWTIAVQDPEKKGDYPDVLRMKDGAIATSGNYEVYYDHEKMFHHIVNPQTGLSPAWSTSASVIAGSAMEADALSTSVFVTPPQKGIEIIDAAPSCECLIISKRGRQHRSKGWNNLRG